MPKDAHCEKECSLLRLARWTRSFAFADESVREPFSKLLRHEAYGFSSVEAVWSAFVLRFGFQESAGKLTPEERAECLALIKRKYVIGEKKIFPFSLFSKKLSYTYLFGAEIGYIRSLFPKYEFSEHLFDELGIAKKIQTVLREYAALLKEGKLVQALSFSRNTEVKGFADTVAPFTECIVREADYYARPRRHVSVFSTMSAGKSTFVNALLGHDYLPSKNEACTAKIITISDIDYIDYCVGYAGKKSGYIFCGDVDQKTLSAWNDDPEVSKIVLEGDLDRISSEETVTVIHDTPGVNYSGNAEHKQITIRHLINAKPDVILCLLDGTQMFTSDFADALNALKKDVIGKEKVVTLFIINKADSFDPKKESLKAVITAAVEYLSTRGFEKPVVIPVSSRAARLFKMALLEKPEFSRKDTILFNEYWDFFSQSENDLRSLAAGVSDAFARDAQYPIEQDAESAVGYKREEIISRLFATGIPVVEHILNTFTEVRL